MLVGLYARIHLDGLDFDAETALPILAEIISPRVGRCIWQPCLPPPSPQQTAMLACSASATQDVFSASEQSLGNQKTTLVVVIAAMGVALRGPDSVFPVLVTVAWGLMTTCFAPPDDCTLLGLVLSVPSAVAACISHPGHAELTHLLGLGDAVYDGATGFVVSMSIVTVASRRPQ